MRTVECATELGIEGKTVTGGFYSYSRNPHHVGIILLYLGIILVTYSIMALITGTIVIVMFVILLFSEEPWLRQQYRKT